MSKQVEQRWYAVQRVAVLFAVVVSPLVVLPGLANAFQLPKLTVIFGAAVVAVGAAALRATESRRLSIARDPVTAVAGALLLGLLLSSLASSTTPRAFMGAYGRYAGFLPYLAYATLFLSIVHAFDRRSLISIVRGLLSAGFLVALYGAVQTVGWDPVEWQLEGLPAAFSTMGNGNFASAYVGTVMPAGVWWLLQRRSDVLWSVVAVGVLGLGVVALVGAASFQGPLVVMVGTAVVLAGVALERYPSWREALAQRASVVAASAVVLLFAGLAVISSLGPTVIAARGYYYDAAVGVFTDNPVLGTGMGTFADYFFQYRAPEHALTLGEFTTNSAHSVPLDVLSGSGIVGFVPYMAFVGLVGWSLVHGLLAAEAPARRLMAVFGAVWLAYQLQSYVSIDVPGLALLQWIAAGAIVLLAREPAFASAFVGRPGRSSVLATVGRAAIVVVALGGLWMATRPLRADLAAAAAVNSLQRGDVEAMQEDFERAHELMGHESLYWYLEATSLERAQMPERALQSLIEAARREPGHSRYALQTARFAEALGRNELALEWFLAAAERDPQAPDVLIQAAEFAAAQGAREQAIELARRVLGLQPGHPQAAPLLAELEGAS